MSKKEQNIIKAFFIIRNKKVDTWYVSHIINVNNYNYNRPEGTELSEDEFKLLKEVLTYDESEIR